MLGNWLGGVAIMVRLAACLLISWGFGLAGQSCCKEHRCVNGPHLIQLEAVVFGN